jgi:hypothetical protein
MWSSMVWTHLPTREFFLAHMKVLFFLKDSYEKIIMISETTLRCFVSYHLGFLEAPSRLVGWLVNDWYGRSRSTKSQLICWA